MNAARHADSNQFSRGFLIVTPGITIKDRLRVLLPNDPDSYYRDRELVPPDMLGDIEHAKIVITNYHAFKLRERMDVSKAGRALLKGRGDGARTRSRPKAQMLQRVCGDLMGMKNIVVLNDEAHHCYRAQAAGRERRRPQGRRQGGSQEEQRGGAALDLRHRGREAQARPRGVYDLRRRRSSCAAPAIAEGTLFPWTVSDFSLMDAIECGIVKLPRVPVADNIPGGDMPISATCGSTSARRCRRRAAASPARSRSAQPAATLQTALDALYGHYAEDFELWEEAGIDVPPVFIVVCNNTATSKLVYDFISGFQRKNEDGTDDARSPAVSSCSATTTSTATACRARARC